MTAKYLQGWVPDSKGVEAVINDPENLHPVFSSSGRKVMDTYEHLDTFLYEPLIWAKPDYRRGAQGIGDCVSWGVELACTLLIAKAAYKARSKSRFIEASTEDKYGGARVEARGIKLGGYSDGANGSYAANFVRKWGVLQRVDYSPKTGNSEHDLRVYSSKKAKEWGNFGCGGKDDNGKLDDVARLMPVKTISQVHSAEECAAAIAGSKCPVTIASMYGTDMRRGAGGYCRWNGSWSHQMCLIGVRFAKDGTPEGFLCAQSWGPNVANGEHWPDSMPENIRGFTWWIPAKDVTRICQGGDSWAIGDVDGWKIDRADWSKELGRL